MMKRLILLVAVLSFVTLTMCAGTETNITVYVTKTGEKYHRQGCSFLRASAIPMALQDASVKHTPCSKCSPPTASSGTEPADTSRVVTPPNPSSGIRAAQSSQCAAMTKKGTRCSRQAQAGSAYCWQHGK